MQVRGLTWWCATGGCSPAIRSAWQWRRAVGSGQVDIVGDDHDMARHVTASTLVVDAVDGRSSRNGLAARARPVTADAPQRKALQRRDARRECQPAARMPAPVRQLQPIRPRPQRKGSDT